MARFVVVVDTQWDFMAADGALSVAGAEGLVAPMQAWLSALKPGETLGVLFTFDTHFRETYAASPEAAMFPIHCVRGTRGWENMLDVALVDPAIPAWRIEKGCSTCGPNRGSRSKTHAMRAGRFPAKSSSIALPRNGSPRSRSSASLRTIASGGLSKAWSIAVLRYAFRPR
ncbi:hypothetical protein [Sphingomonas sp. LR55]|uniref:hypothetical protein n=1 Tax=Sphingomonas sp. LR55 TaxID=3050231 RepID=UPI002FE3487A